MIKHDQKDIGNQIFRGIVISMIAIGIISIVGFAVLWVIFVFGGMP